MATKARMIAPYFWVILDDGAELQVQANNWDMLSYERYARKHRWEAYDAIPMESATFIAWQALRRESLIPPDLTYELFAGTDTVPGRAVSIEGKRVSQDPTRPAVADD